MPKATQVLKGQLASLVPSPGTAWLTFSSVNNGLVTSKVQPFKLYQLSDFADDVIGTAGAEAIFAYDGNDRVLADGGNDLVDGGNGNDTIYGGGGNDDLRGGAGDDFLDGGAGADVMTGGFGNDRYVVDALDAVVEKSGEGTDTVMTNLASYTLPAHVENLEFFVTVGSGPVTFQGTGNELANVITGWSSTDTLVGGGGNDTLNGDGGNDQLHGGEGLDRMDGGTGADSMWGGAGDDLYIVDNAGDQVIEGIGMGIDTVLTTLASYTLPAGADRVTYNGAASFTGTGNELDNVVTGGAKADLLDGGSGNDTVVGFGGNDQLRGGAGNDLLKGGQGDDVYLDVDSSDTIVELAGEGLDTVMVAKGSYTMPANVENAQASNGLFHQIFGNTMANKITGNIGKDLIDGEGGNDTVNGGDGDDYVDGGAGNDQVLGGEGHDVLVGNSGNDSLIGGNGNDSLEGNMGRDVLAGGSGADRFIFSHLDGGFTDVISDFTQGSDKIDLSAFDANPALAGDQALAFAFTGSFIGGGIGSVRYELMDTHINVYVDADGNGQTDVQIEVHGVPGFLTLADFIF